MSKSANVEEVKMYEGKYGFYPCSKETFLKLKKLNQAYMRAQRMAAEWSRWDRKAPQNRVIRIKLRDEKGNQIGSKVVGPRDEPKTCPVFSKKPGDKGYNARWNGQRNGKSYWASSPRRSYCYYGSENGGTILVDSFGVEAAYKMAKRPRRKVDIEPLCISDAEIDRLCEELGI